MVGGRLWCRVQNETELYSGDRRCYQFWCPDSAPTERDEHFGLAQVTKCSGVPDEVLQPAKAWSNPDAYPLVVVRPQGPHRLALESEQAVGVVLDHEQARALADAEDLRPAGGGEGDSGRIVEVRHRVEELGPPPGRGRALDGLLQRGRISPSESWPHGPRWPGSRRRRPGRPRRTAPRPGSRRRDR